MRSPSAAGPAVWGAALGVVHLAGNLAPALAPMSKHELRRAAGASRQGQAPPAGVALVTGAHGRSGRGAQRALMTAGVPVARKHRQETRDLHEPTLLGHDLLVNCVVSAHPRRLRSWSGRTWTTSPGCGCSRDSDLRRDRARQHAPGEHRVVTTWQEPVRRLHDGTPEHQQRAAGGHRHRQPAPFAPARGQRGVQR